MTAERQNDYDINAALGDVAMRLPMDDPKLGLIITEVYRLRAALAASEEKARGLREALTKLLWAFDGNHTISGHEIDAIRAALPPFAGSASEANEKCGIRISGDEWCALPHPHDGPHRGKQHVPASEACVLCMEIAPPHIAAWRPPSETPPWCHLPKGHGGWVHQCGEDRWAVRAPAPASEEPKR